MLLKLAILSVFMVTNLFGSVYSPLLPFLIRDFEMDAAMSKLFLMAPSLIIIPFILLSGFLSLKASKKHLIIIGLVIYFFAGIGCYFANSINEIFFFRGLYGLGAGLIIPYTNSLIDYFYKYDEKSTMISYSMLSMFLGSAFLIFMIGVFNGIYWRLGFLFSAFFSVIPLLLMQFIPPLPTGSKHKYPFIFNIIFKKQVLWIASVYFVVVILVFQYFTNLSLMIFDRHLGSFFESSLAQSFFFLSGVLASLLMPIILKASLYLLFAFQSLFISHGFSLLSMNDINMLHIYLASSFMGFGYGTVGAGFLCMLMNYATSVNKVHAISLLFASMSFGQFMAPVTFNYLVNVFPVFDTTRVFGIISIIFIVLAITLLILYIYNSVKRYIKDFNFL